MGVASARNNGLAIRGENILALLIVMITLIQQCMKSGGYKNIMPNGKCLLKKHSIYQIQKLRGRQTASILRRSFCM